MRPMEEREGGADDEWERGAVGRVRGEEEDEGGRIQKKVNNYYEESEEGNSREQGHAADHGDGMNEGGSCTGRGNTCTMPRPSCGGVCL